MSVITDIRDLLKLVASNQKAAKWLLIIIIVGGIAGFFYLKYRPSKPESDCAFIKQQNKELLAFILEARKGIKELAQPTSYIKGGNYFSFASYDTVPTTKQQKAVVLLSKFDSLLLKLKQDSIQRSKQKN